MEQDRLGRLCVVRCVLLTAAWWPARPRTRILQRLHHGVIYALLASVYGFQNGWPTREHGGTGGTYERIAEHISKLYMYTQNACVTYNKGSTTPRSVFSNLNTKNFRAVEIT